MQPVAYTLFTDGVMRPVYDDDEHGQFVVDEHGAESRRVWFGPREERDVPGMVNIRS